MPHKTGYFKVPSSWISKDIEGGDEKVVVISVFGQSTIDHNGYKTSPIEKMLGKNVLGRNLMQPIQLDDEVFAGIEGYYDQSQQIVFLHLTGAFDSSTLYRSLCKMNEQLQEKGFLVAWSELRLQYARCLLLMFSVSHVLLLFHSNHVFDITYIHLFRTLDSIRSKFLQSSIEILNGIPGVSRDWQMNGRMCSPRVLFIFSSHLIPLHILNEAVNANKTTGINKSEGNPTCPLRKLELDLEYQIYRLLRKSRVITNISANSLFALPNNQPFVFITEDTPNDMAATSLLKNTLNDLCSISSGLTKLLFSGVRETPNYSGGKPHSGSESGLRKPGSEFINSLSDIADADALSNSLLSPVSAERKRNLEHSFNLFLRQHIEEALTRGFIDSVGRHATPHFFEVPKANVWFEAFHKLYEFYAIDSANTEENENQLVSSLKSNLETDIRFSDARCAKVLPLAVSAYSDGLPTHYTKARHQSKLNVALGILAAQSRGPMYESYVTQLEETCEAIWKDGRIGCETLSLTGKSCCHPRHADATEPESSLPVLNHNSNVVYANYCNCGRHQSTMEDPYTVKAANYDFYQKMSDNFCLPSEFFSFPSFQSSVEDARAADVFIKMSQEWPDFSTDVSRSSRSVPNTDVDTPQTPLGMSLHSPGLSQGMGENPPRVPEGTEGGSDEDEIIVTVKEEKEDTGENDLGKNVFKESGIGRQASTTEYLPGMLTTSSPPGLLPQFPSWSLVCLGPSSFYSHNAGICEQPGFLNGTNFLLPWDVNIKIKDKNKWPAIADSMGKKGFLLKNKKNRMGGELTEFSVKIFLGTEYQCPRGHRFMMASPDRPLQSSPAGHVKDTAVKISNSDMPLYFPCPCSRRGSFVNGQLIRVHIVTPKAPVHVTLNPQIQPAPDPCPKFIPQPPSAPSIKLSASAYWVLRLPFSYVGDSGPLYPPNPYQVDVSTYGKLMKGCYGISELSLDG